MQEHLFAEPSVTLRAAYAHAPSGYNFSKPLRSRCPVIAEQSGVPALRETARAIVDTAKWWP